MLFAPVAMAAQVLRTTATLSTTALFIPLTDAMLRVFECNDADTWLNTSWRCFTGVHLALTFAVCVVAIAFAAFALLGTQRGCTGMIVLWGGGT